MDILYVGDIPQDYHYALYNSNYIDLYKVQNISSNDDFYRIYLYDNFFTYEHLFTNNAITSSVIGNYIKTSDDWYYRRDMPSIMFMSLVECLIIVLILNIVSSVFKKGGVFSGLL